MSVPFYPAAQPGQRNAQGYVSLPGGYEDAIAARNGQQPQAFTPQQVQPAPQQNQPLYQPAPSQPAPLPPWQPSNPNPMPPQGWPGQAGQPYTPQAVPQLSQQQAPPSYQLPGQQPQQIPQPTAQPGVDPNLRLAGPGIPVELQGRTLGELIQIHNGLRQIHLQSLAQGPQQHPQQQTQQVQQQPQQTQGQQPTTQNGQQSGWDWRNPEQAIERTTERVVSRLMEERLMPALAPMMQNSALQSINNARNQAMQQIGPQRYAQLEPIINQSLQGIHPQALTNPQTWIVAAERAAGAITLNPTLAAQYGIGAPPPQNGQRYAAPGQPGIHPAQVVQPGQQPLPNLNTFFSEQPNQGGPGVAQVSLSAEQMRAADLMGMPHAVYAAWAGGQQVAPQQAAGGWR